MRLTPGRGPRDASRRPRPELSVAGRDSVLSSASWIGPSARALPRRLAGSHGCPGRQVPTVTSRPSRRSATSSPSWPTTPECGLPARGHSPRPHPRRMAGQRSAAPDAGPSMAGPRHTDRRGDDGVALVSSVDTFATSYEDPLPHLIEHVLFLVAGRLFWWPVIGADPIPWRLSPIGRMVYLARRCRSTRLGLAIYFAPAVLYPHYATLGRAWGPTRYRPADRRHRHVGRRRRHPAGRAGPGHRRLAAGR